MSSRWFAAGFAAAVGASLTVGSSLATRPATSLTAMVVSRDVDADATALMRATDAQRFVASVGVNVHTSYNDTTYGNARAVLALLNEMGVRHVRDGMKVDRPDVYAAWQTFKANGIGLDLLVGDPLQRFGSGTLDQAFSSLEKLGSTIKVDALEGPNEFNQDDKDWISIVRKFQQSLWLHRNSSPRYRSTPVYGPSLTSYDAMHEIGNLASFLTFVNIHPYSGGDIPDRSLRDNIENVRSMAPGAPVVSTESGYHNALSDRVDQPAIPLSAGAVYIPNQYLEFFRQGVARTYNYELLDEHPDPAETQAQSHFGLATSNYQLKPAGRALQRLLAYESGPALPGAAAALPVSLTARNRSKLPASVHTLLLVHPGGIYDLIEWNDVRVWDQNARRAISVAPISATLHVGRSMKVTAYDVIGGAATPSRAADGSTVTIRPGATILRLRPGS